MQNRPYFSPIIDKLQFLRRCICELEGRVRSRIRHKHTFLSGLEERMCDVKNAIFRLDTMGDSASQRRTALEHQLLDLERELRQQEVECWRDVTILQKDIMPLEREYRSAGAICSVQKN